jgi:hypothetical protein
MYTLEYLRKSPEQAKDILQREQLKGFTVPQC